ncbi:unnamed protein product [Bursaphelenchus xylophilus]|uniref:(pine wood nematode) hypothetical protein n=1 Tax=Bursaphelenchus xylophilus TaxID=6326 RepID=A0A1I7RV27_BURXY|nr:unnamed protein product [Bursaphelenchus xylophilus]CAG9105175.1 unnamed protein product [Bursaphelenchus xylophilus]
MFEHGIHCGVYDQGPAVYTEQAERSEYALQLFVSATVHVALQLLFIFYVIGCRRCEDDGNKLMVLISFFSIIILTISGPVAAWISEKNVKYCDGVVLMEILGYLLTMSWIIYTSLLTIYGWYVTTRILRRKTYLHGRRLFLAIGGALLVSSLALSSDPPIYSATFGFWDYNPFLEFEDTTVSGGHEVIYLYNVFVCLAMGAMIVFWFMKRENVPGPNHIDLNNTQDYQFFVFMGVYFSITIIIGTILFTDGTCKEGENFCQIFHLLASFGFGSNVVYSIILSRPLRTFFRRITRKSPIYASDSYISSDTATNKTTATDASHQNPANYHNNPV